MKHDPRPFAPVPPHVPNHPVVGDMRRERGLDHALRARMLDDWLLGQLSLPG
ncbi:hypothetical protein [Sphingomonas sp.]|uniref:hypothetical protein n=1 Tax=Sphingomonas sp. TaxID=28214 RepID=UPI0031D446C0